MATRRRKSRRKSCKYGKLKRKSGRRRCRKSRRRKCKYGKLKRKSKRRRCRKTKRRRKHKINFGDIAKTYALKTVGIKSKICKRGSKRSTKKGKSGSTTKGSGSSSCVG